MGGGRGRRRSGWSSAIVVAGVVALFAFDAAFEVFHRLFFAGRHLPVRPARRTASSSSSRTRSGPRRRSRSGRSIVVLRRRSSPGSPAAPGAPRRPREHAPPRPPAPVRLESPGADERHPGRPHPRDRDPAPPVAGSSSSRSSPPLVGRQADALEPDGRHDVSSWVDRRIAASRLPRSRSSPTSWPTRIVARRRGLEVEGDLGPLLRRRRRVVDRRRDHARDEARDRARRAARRASRIGGVCALALAVGLLARAAATAAPIAGHVLPSSSVRSNLHPRRRQPRPGVSRSTAAGSSGRSPGRAPATRDGGAGGRRRSGAYVGWLADRRRAGRDPRRRPHVDGAHARADRLVPAGVVVARSIRAGRGPGLIGRRPGRRRRWSPKLRRVAPQPDASTRSPTRLLDGDGPARRCRSSADDERRRDRRGAPAPRGCRGGTGPTTRTADVMVGRRRPADSSRPEDEPVVALDRLRGVAPRRAAGPRGRTLLGVLTRRSIAAIVATIRGPASRASAAAVRRVASAT